MRVQMLELWQLRVAGCTHCDVCLQPPHACCLAATDDCEMVFDAVRSAARLLWISPVYFYGLPAQAKALVDRGQRFHVRHEQIRAPLAGSTTAVFVAARTAGVKLFEGSRLSLTYFTALLDRPLVEGYGVRGLERAGDISDELRAALRAAGRGEKAMGLEPLQ